MGQKIALGVELEPYLAEEAKQRQGARNDIVEKVPQSEQARSRDQAAAVVGVSGKTLSAARNQGRHDLGEESVFFCA